MTKLENQTENPNLTTFRKQMALLNVMVYPEMLVYKLATPKLANGCIDMAMKIINKHALPLVAERPSSIGNTFIVKEKAI